MIQEIMVPAQLIIPAIIPGMVHARSMLFIRGTVHAPLQVILPRKMRTVVAGGLFPPLK
jgi:hypothetical protein